MLNKLYAVITTIQGPTACVRHLDKVLSQSGSPLLIIGDSKGPFEYALKGTDLWTLERQNKSRYKLAKELPIEHYSRKNLGYLFAIDQGAECIYETDDDNGPLSTWRIRSKHVEAIPLSNKSWTNVYRCFTDELIWPRGLPLEFIHAPGAQPAFALGAKALKSFAPIQQGLANNSPDVDAVWRLVLDRDFSFKDSPSVMLSPGAWCPFNSQTTWWWPEVYALLYLPSYCSFRMTDIWRSFIAQRCLWELESGVVFHAPEAYQERNVHSLFRDFEAEVPGYLKNGFIAQILDNLTLKPGLGNVADNLVHCYEQLVQENIFPAEEMNLLRCWHSDIQDVITHD